MQPVALEMYAIDKTGFWLWMILWLGPHWLFLSSLLSAQVSRILRNKVKTHLLVGCVVLFISNLAKTTAEAINSKINPHRYQYLNQLNRGALANCLTFFGTPCRPENLDLEFGKSTADAF